MEVIEYNLRREGYEVSVAEDGKTGLALVRKVGPELVLLDLMLPEVDGLTLCRELKNDPLTQSIPIIMVTAKAEESDIVLGLGLGADDYVTKPFSPKELIARVKAALRRSSDNNSGKATACINIGPLLIDPERFLLQVSGQTLTLTKTEFRILHKLASQAGRVFTREQLLQATVGENVIVIDRNIDVHIRAIRKALGEYRYLIETVRGIGYRFVDNLD